MYRPPYKRPLPLPYKIDGNNNTPPKHPSKEHATVTSEMNEKNALLDLNRPDSTENDKGPYEAQAIKGNDFEFNPQ